MTKKEIYKEYGIEYKSGKIFHLEFGLIPELLVNGNTKIGKGIYHFSHLPTNQTFSVKINGKEYTIKGTCPCTCDGCYATKGNFNYPSVKKSLAIKTWLVRNDLNFVKRALSAQIIADHIEYIRLHASGDFDSIEYAKMIKDIVKTFGYVTFWTYTKNRVVEDMFSDTENMNIVKSVIKGRGFNFGHIDYILSLYAYLKAQGNDVYICRCGIDKNQHCTNCKGCSKNEYVLFIEHSTEYKAENDPMYEVIRRVIDEQPKQ